MEEKETIIVDSDVIEGTTEIPEIENIEDVENENIENEIEGGI